MLGRCFVASNVTAHPAVEDEVGRYYFATQPLPCQEHLAKRQLPALPGPKLAPGSLENVARAVCELYGFAPELHRWMTCQPSQVTAVADYWLSPFAIGYHGYKNLTDLLHAYRILYQSAGCNWALPFRPKVLHERTACTISNSYNANDEAVEPVETSRNFEFDEALLPFTRCFADFSDEIAASALPRDLGLHDDALITPISPVWCDVCGRMLFGLMQDCVRCAECGRVACKTCAFTRSCAVKEIRQYLEAGAQLPFHLQDRCGEAVMVLPVVKRHPSVLRYVPQELWRDETFLRQFLDLGGHDAGLRQAAKQQLSGLEKPDKDEIAGAVLAVLRQGFESSGVAFALELLAQLAEKSPAVLAVAKERLNDADAVVRAAAVSAVSLLARKDDRACRSVPRELFRRLEDESQAVRSAAIDALPQLHAEGRRKLSALTPRLQAEKAKKQLETEHLNQIPSFPMSGDARDPTDEEVEKKEPGRGGPSPAASSRERRLKGELALEELALKGSCVKDGGVAHAMLLVPMRMEQRRLLPVRGLPRQMEARLRAAVRASFCLKPQRWHGFALEQRMIQLQADRQLALAAVERRGMALQHVPAELRDRELVLTAVRSRPRALEFAPPQLQRDRDVVLAALTAPGGHKALGFAAAFNQDQEVQATVQQVQATLAETKKLADEGLQLDLRAERPSDLASPANAAILQIVPDDMLCLLHL
ncbi:unnamed protein product [Symbiodinium necroappetens]|uniref:DUF4116 domain-containing protein n=1 Tax=Symbiodinium necroappetens TaxID=1628268 RepID=A0A812ZX03_9DINO|nr:unnamed protein product [Symbiodinium necroappetens]